MRHSGETQFAVLPVFEILSSVTGSSRGSACSACSSHCLARQTLAGPLFCGPRESVFHTRPSQLWFNPQLDFLIRVCPAASGGVSGLRYVYLHNPVSLKLPSEFKHISKWWKRNDKGFFK